MALVNICNKTSTSLLGPTFHALLCYAELRGSDLQVSLLHWSTHLQTSYLTRSSRPSQRGSPDIWLSGSVGADSQHPALALDRRGLGVHTCRATRSRCDNGAKVLRCSSAQVLHPRWVLPRGAVVTDRDRFIIRFHRG
jgi:hypothetical protein